MKRQITAILSIILVSTPLVNLDAARTSKKQKVSKRKKVTKKRAPKRGVKKAAPKPIAKAAPVPAASVSPIVPTTIHVPESHPDDHQLAALAAQRQQLEQQAQTIAKLEQVNAQVLQQAQEALQAKIVTEQKRQELLGQIEELKRMLAHSKAEKVPEPVVHQAQQTLQTVEPIVAPIVKKKLSQNQKKEILSRIMARKKEQESLASKAKSLQEALEQEEIETERAADIAAEQAALTFVEPSAIRQIDQNPVPSAEQQESQTKAQLEKERLEREKIEIQQQQSRKEQALKNLTKRKLDAEKKAANTIDSTKRIIKDWADVPEIKKIIGMMVTLQKGIQKVGQEPLTKFIIDTIEQKADHIEQLYQKAITIHTERYFAKLRGPVKTEPMVQPELKPAPEAAPAGQQAKESAPKTKTEFEAQERDAQEQLEHILIAKQNSISTLQEWASIDNSPEVQSDIAEATRQKNEIEKLMEQAKSGGNTYSDVLRLVRGGKF